VEREYIVVSDKNSKVLLSTTDYQEARKLVNRIASAGGSATLFRSMK
jgi:hypothetical protein